jgi:hypothetical protein
MLGEPDVLEELPQRVGEPWRAGAPALLRHALDDAVEPRVRVFPTQHRGELLPQRPVTHGLE